MKRRLIQELLVISTLLLLVGTTGCLSSPAYERRKMEIPADSLLRLEFSVATNETLEGSWEAGATVAGSLRSPKGTKSSWSQSSVEHLFAIDGEKEPGLYVFTFNNTGSGSSTLIFRHRLMKRVRAGQTTVEPPVPTKGLLSLIHGFRIIANS